MVSGTIFRARETPCRLRFFSRLKSIRSVEVSQWQNLKDTYSYNNTKIFHRGVPKWVRVGELNFKITTDDAMPQTRSIAKMIKHPKYKRIFKYHDIALLKLDSPVTFNAYARPACLSLVPSYPDDYRISAVATGWGLTQDDGNVHAVLFSLRKTNCHCVYLLFIILEDAGSAELMTVSLPLVPHANCSSLYAAYNTVLPNGLDDETQLCAGGQQYRDTCQVSVISRTILYIRIYIEYCAFFFISPLPHLVCIEMFIFTLFLIKLL